jgi:hypothetical protein
MTTFGIIYEEPPQRCEQCDVIAETRPYGLNHEEVCFDCAMKDEAVTEMRMKEYLTLGGDVEDGR